MLAFLSNLSLVQIIVAVLGVGFVIAFHELGHYVAARALGMRVLRYSIGFGPKLVGFTKGGIEYQLSAIPFGGFVQIAGMSSFDEAAKDDPRSYLNQARWKRWLVLFGGPAFNYLAAFFFFFAYFAAWPSPLPTDTLAIADIHEGPAKAAGVARGEYVIKTNGVDILSEQQFRTAVGTSDGQPLTLTLFNEDSKATRDVVIVPTVVDGGFKLGVSLEMRSATSGPLQIAEAAVVNVYNETARTLMALKALVQRQPGVDVGGPLAMVAGMKDRVALGLRYFVHTMALLSVSLGLFNLLPVPALDGIKMLWLTIEGALRRNINLKMQEMINAVGFIVLLVLMAGLTVRDGFRLFG